MYDILLNYILFLTQFPGQVYGQLVGSDSVCASETQIIQINQISVYNSFTFTLNYNSCEGEQCKSAPFSNYRMCIFSL